MQVIPLQFLCSFHLKKWEYRNFLFGAQAELESLTKLCCGDIFQQQEIGLCIQTSDSFAV